MPEMQLEMTEAIKIIICLLLLRKKALQKIENINASNKCITSQQTARDMLNLVHQPLLKKFGPKMQSFLEFSKELTEYEGKAQKSWILYCTPKYFFFRNTIKLGYLESGT